MNCNLESKLLMTDTRVGFLELFPEIKERLTPAVSLWIESLDDPNDNTYQPGGILNPQNTAAHLIKDMLTERRDEFSKFDIEILGLLRSCCLKDPISLGTDEVENLKLRREITTPGVE